jgi:hypothetical protein
MGIIDLIHGVDRFDLWRRNIFRTTAGVCLILSAHFLWAVGMLWAMSKPGGLDRSLPGALAGPNLAIGVAIADGGTGPSRLGPAILALCFATQLVGIWLLTSAAWGRITRSAVVTMWVLRLIPIIFAPISFGVMRYTPKISAPDGPFVACAHLVQAGLGLAWGAYVFELGRALRSKVLAGCGQLVLVLLTTGSIATAASMLSGTSSIDLSRAGGMLTAAGSVLLCGSTVKLLGVVHAPQPPADGLD